MLIKILYEVFDEANIFTGEKSSIIVNTDDRDKAVKTFEAYVRSQGKNWQMVDIVGLVIPVKRGDTVIEPIN